MASSKCLLVVLSLVCLNLVSGLQSLNGEEVPGTIDEVLVKTAGKRTMINTGRAGSDLVSDGLDMMLTKEQHARLFEGSRGRSDEPLFITWTNNIIPYELIPGHFQEHHKSKIAEAVEVWQSLTCLTFTTDTAPYQNKIQIFNGEGCWSELGMVKEARPQLLSLQGTGCFWRGTVAHEFGHAIGLVHEHQRPNRDDYISINEYNIMPNYLSQVRKYLPSAVNKMGLGYDYYSVMHYGQHAFAYNPTLQTMFAYDKATRQRRPDITKNLGKVLGPSYMDVKLVNMMYNCNAHCKTKPACGADCFVDKNCKCFCKSQMEEDKLSVPCRDHMSDCQQRAAAGLCLDQRFYMEIYCRKTCQMCAVRDGLPPEEVPDAVVPCTDREAECPDWAEMGDCSRNPDYMLVYCRKSCKRCKGSDGGTVTTQPSSTSRPVDTTALPCDNKNPSCEEWASGNQCNINPGYMHNNCRKACNLCGGGGGQVTDCRDNNPSCKSWADYGECDRNPSYMLNNCKKSCNVC